MQLKRFLGNLVKASLAMGVLAVPAFAGADTYYDHSNNGQQYIHHNDLPPSQYAGNQSGCCHSDSCCGFPVNPAPECGWAYNPPAYARCGSCQNNHCDSLLDSFGFRIDFLWWRASVNGLFLGTEEQIDTFSGATSPERLTVFNRSHTKRHNFKYDPGFRIGFGTACACDCWDFAVNWTHFRTKAHARGFADSDNNIIFIPEFERIVDVFPTEARGRYTLNIDLVDIEFGRKFYVSSCFVLRPEFGLRFARINQNHRIESLSQGFPDIFVLANFTSDVKARSDFLGVGPKIGLCIELDVGCGLSLFGQASGSVAFGKFSNHAREHFVDFTTDEDTEIGTFDYEGKESSHRTSRAITDLAFGVKWVRCLEWCNRTHPVSLAFAWEHHAYYNMQNFNFASRGVDFDGDVAVVNGTGSRNRIGDIYTQGLTVSLGFGF